MKKSIVSLVLFLLVVCLVSESFAQKGKGKGKGGKRKNTTAAVDTTAKQAPKVAPTVAVDNTPKPEVKPAEPALDYIVLGDTATKDTVHFPLSKLIADSNILELPKYSIDTSRPSDGFYKATTLKGARPFQFPEEKVDNIKKYKRLWREIDLRDSVNAIFKVPGETLIDAIMKSIQSGRLIAYKDEDFTHAMTYQAAMNEILGDSQTVNTQDTTTGEITGTKKVAPTWNPDSILKFEIKEDIYFDKVRGRVITEIIGFSPVSPIKSSAGEIVGIKHPFHIYFKQLRKLLAAREVTDLPRDISNISFDDIFISRNFHSRIIKEGSPGGLKIADKFKSEEDQIKESNRIEQEIKNFRRGLFKYY
jgi:gliding motility associated protien GldN